LDMDFIKVSINSMKELAEIIRKLEKYDVDVDIKFPVLGQVESISTKGREEGRALKNSIINYYYGLINDIKNNLWNHIDRDIFPGEEE